jgi:hypothetical protein
MKRIALTITAAVLTTGLITPAAEATDNARHRDTPGCVTKAEFRQVSRGTTQARVKAIFDTAGRRIGRFDNSYEDYTPGSYVEGYDESFWVPGYRDEFGEYHDATYDATGNELTPAGWTAIWVPGYYDSYYVDGYWEDDEYYNVSVIDTYRSYKKCKSFNRGRGRVAINFDNYTSNYAGMRVYAKHANNPWRFILGARQTDVLAGKQVPTS